MSTLTYEQMMALYDREREAREAQAKADRKALMTQIKADREAREMQEKALAAQIQADREALEAKIQSDREENKVRSAALDKLSLDIKEISRQLAHIGFSNGEAAEDFFYSSLETKRELGDIHFDEIERNLHRRKDRIEDEYDIFLKNGNAVAIVEVKYKVTTDHINQLTTRKVQNFRKLFPKFAKHKVYTGIAGMSFDRKSEALAKESGVAVLKQKGDHLVVKAKTLRAY